MACSTNSTPSPVLDVSVVWPGHQGHREHSPGAQQAVEVRKEHKDVSLHYNPIGHPSELQLLCFFDAGFTARSDGSSQGGYILMLVNRQLLTSGEDGEYHVLDWRSFRTPRVTRSSLAAEAQ